MPSAWHRRYLTLLAFGFVALCGWGFQTVQSSATIQPFPDEDVNWNAEWDDAGVGGKAGEEGKKRSGFQGMGLKSGALSLEGELMPSYGCRLPKLPTQVCSPASIPVSWDYAPPGTKSFVLLVDEETSEPRFFVHWFVKDIRRGKSLEAGASGKPRMLNGGVEMPNSYRNSNFAGPAAVEPATFRIVLLALRTEHLDLDDYFEENPTALGNEIQHAIIKTGNVLAADYLKFTWPGQIFESVGEETRVVHAGANAAS